MSLISHSSYSLAPAAGGNYSLCIDFYDEAAKVVSSRGFTFFPARQAPAVEESKEGEVGAATLFDVHSQNGSCHGSKFLARLFSQKDVDCAVAGSALAQEMDPAHSPTTMFVVDLKDPKEGYRDTLDGTIAKCERVVCDFFKGASVSSKQDRLKLIHGLNPDFILCEGSLKIDILKSGGFSVSEIDYFHTPSGAAVLCQCAEFFMNAFKMGDSAQGETVERLTGSKYITCVSKRLSCFTPCKTSTVLYPSHYAALYSLDSHFARTLSEVFSVAGEERAGEEDASSVSTHETTTSSKITVMTVRRK